VATSSSLATFIHPVFNRNVWSLASKLAHIWAILADTSVCVRNTLVLSLNGNALLACTAGWWLWLDNILTFIISRDTLLLDATTQVSSLLSLTCLIASDVDIEA
jgi:hypothetical protein